MTKPIIVLHPDQVKGLREHGVEPPQHILAEKIPMRECSYYHGQPCSEECAGRGFCLDIA